MYVANPIDPSFPSIRYLHALGPASEYPRLTESPAHRRTSRLGASGERGQLSAVAGIVLAVAAFGAGFVGGITAAAPMPEVQTVVDYPLPGEFLLGPGNMTPPGIVVPLS